MFLKEETIKISLKALVKVENSIWLGHVLMEMLLHELWILDIETYFIMS